MTAKHTPGPHFLCHEDGLEYSPIKTKTLIMGYDACSTGSTEIGAATDFALAPPDEVREANARLFVSAWEMELLLLGVCKGGAWGRLKAAWVFFREARRVLAFIDGGSK